MWLSEIMLQQTTVATVIPRFQRFLERWPTIDALAAATDEEILSEWAGLGYYARARNLIACAREVVRRGGFPTVEAQLRELPGVGSYTAAAIAAIAFGERAAAVDTNVERVLARLDGATEARRPQIASRLVAFMEGRQPGDIVQALMDLGAIICRPRQPRCNDCPLSTDCAAFASGQPERFSAKRQRKARPRRHGTVWWIERNGHVWLVRRPSTGLLGGMAALPGGEWIEGQMPRRKGIGTVRHVFTHFSLDLTVECRSEPVGEGWWHPIAALAGAGLPTLYRRAAELALQPRRAARAAA